MTGSTDIALAVPPAARTAIRQWTAVRCTAQPDRTAYNTFGYLFDAVVRHPVLVA